VLLSILPPLAPVLMPVRIASGDAQLWQIALAAVLTVATIVGLNFGAGRIYANSVLRTGTRVRLRDAWSGPA
jgi:ABC-2 type transport system permease protein